MKKILVIADIHQKRFIINSLDNLFYKNKFDAVLMLGDLTDRNSDALAFAKEFYSIIKKYKLKLLYLHGNNEPQEVIDFFNDLKCSIHNNPTVFGSIKFVGIGGWGDDIDINTMNNIKDSFFVTHVPPIKNKIRNKLENVPKIHAFGHSHRNEYFRKEGNIFYLSVKSAGYYKRAAIVDTPNFKVKFIDI